MPLTRPRRASFAAVAILTVLLPAPAASAASPSTLGTTRRVGDSTDVALAAIDISTDVWADGAARVVALGRDDLFADSLAGAALAGTRGPVLFTAGGPDAALRPEVRAEIARVLPPPTGCTGPGEVDLLGGTGAVSTTVEHELQGLGYCVRRIGGTDRIETAALIAARADDARQVLLARADTWPDSATASAYAAATGHPILVTPTGSLAPSVARFLDANRPDEIVLLGGTAALSSAVADQAGAYGATIRVAGATRDATAAAIATTLSAGLAPRGVALVDGWSTNGWAYAIAGAVDAAVDGTVELFVQPATIPAATAAHLDAAADEFTVAIGPASLVSDDVVREIETSRTWQLMPPPGSSPRRYRDAVFTDVTKTSGVTYGTAVDRSGTTVTLTLDVYRPSGDTATSRPAIVWVHGGGFSGGDKSSPEIVDEATTFARKGYVNVSINYRLEPEGCSAAAPTGACITAIQEALEDAQAAVRFLRSKASTYGIDTTRIAIGGSSAGAITALHVGYRSSEDPASAVRATVSLSGASVLAPITAGDAPALLLHGTDDGLVPYSWATRTVADARATGVVADLTTWQGAGHVPYVDHHDEILEQTRNFLWWMLDLDSAT